MFKVLLLGRGGGWQLVASSSLSKLFIDLAAPHALLSNPGRGLCLPHTLTSPSLRVSLRIVFLRGRALLPSLQMLYVDP